MARVYAKLLGPCFKTGRIGDQLLHREPTWERETPPQPPTESSHAMPTPGSNDSAPVRRPSRGTSRPNNRRRAQVPPKGRPLGPGPEAGPQVSAQMPANAPQPGAKGTPGVISNPAHRYPRPLAEYEQLRWLYPFPSYRFHVLFNSLFKVLCNFPSRYFFAIGLVGIFSLR
jgi:hypothetical protein